MHLDGSIDDRFAAVGRQFERILRAPGELGASLAVTHRGKLVVDLYGGLAEPHSGRRWQRDSVCVFWSCTKAATVFCIHLLVDRGLLDLDAPVAHYWPEFAQAGKHALPVRMLLNHQAGLPVFRNRLARGGLLDWERCMRDLASQTPLWQPGLQHGYHGFTMGFLLGELVRRVSGRSLSMFFRMEVGVPLGLDFWIGLPASEEDRVVPVVLTPGPKTEPASSFVRALAEPKSIAAQVMNLGDAFDPAIYDSRAAHAAELPASGGIGNARGLAGLYQPLACRGMTRGRRVISEESIAEMSSVASAGIDTVTLIPSRYSSGLQKRMDNRRQPPGDQASLLIPETAFGHAGFGGSIGFADPAAELSFAFVTNRGVTGGIIDARAETLIAASYESLGAARIADSA